MSSTKATIGQEGKEDSKPTNNNEDGSSSNPNTNTNSSTSTSTNSLIDDFLKNGDGPLLTIPEDSNYVYPVTAFPPLSSFDISVTHPAIVIPAKRTSELRKRLKEYILSRSKLKVVYGLSDDDPIPKVSVKTVDEEEEDEKQQKEHSNDDKRQTIESESNSRSKYRKIVLQNQPDIFEKEIIKELLNDNDTGCCCCCKAEHQIHVSYVDWTAEEILRKILPFQEVPSAFEIIGHLAHINLRDELLPFKYIIGKVILDKNTPRIKTIVNKLGSIDTKFRTFGMEIIAGNSDGNWSLVTVKEEGCSYTMDFRKVYWNSRLGREHRRLVDIIRADALRRRRQASSDGGTGPPPVVVVADLMAGIGPFAIPLTSTNKMNNGTTTTKGKDKKKKKNDSKNNKNKENNDEGRDEIKKKQGEGKNDNDTTGTNDYDNSNIHVYANDLNPTSYKYLLENAKRNKCSNLFCYNMDARAFCHYLQNMNTATNNSSTTNDTYQQQQQEEPRKKKIEFHHVIMNLPASAPEFLNAFCGFQNTTLPRIHVHCFGPKQKTTTTRTTTKEEEEEEAVIEDDLSSQQEVINRCSTALGCQLDIERDNVVVHLVRDVAPKKNMFCVSFTLPEQVRGLKPITTPLSTQQQEEQEQSKKDDVVEDDEENNEPDVKRAKLG